jgi:hypothetical protein
MDPDENMEDEYDPAIARALIESVVVATPEHWCAGWQRACVLEVRASNLQEENANLRMSVVLWRWLAAMCVAMLIGVVVSRVV